MTQFKKRINNNPIETTIAKKIFQSSVPSPMLEILLPLQSCVCYKLNFLF